MPSSFFPFLVEPYHIWSIHIPLNCFELPLLLLFLYHICVFLSSFEIQAGVMKEQ
jgi:hypothetical protein